MYVVLKVLKGILNVDSGRGSIIKLPVRILQDGLALHWYDGTLVTDQCIIMTY